MALHIRVISPPSTTESLVRAMAANDGVTDLVVLPSARRPAGDPVEFDVDPTAANDVLRTIRELGIDRHAPIAVDELTALIGAQPRAGHRRGVVQRDLPPIWDLIEARIRTEAVYPPSFYALLIIAGLIAATGILTNSQILIVGAMVVGPEYSAIMGIALGIDRHERRPITSGLLALLAGFSAAVIAALIFGLCIRELGRTPHFYSVGIRPVSNLVNTPNLFSVIVAVLAGIVGVVSLTEARAGALIGVFISVTTIPAAADTGLSTAYESWSEAGGSALQLLINVTLLVAVGAAGLRLQRKVWHYRPAPP